AEESLLLVIVDAPIPPGARDGRFQIAPTRPEADTAPAEEGATTVALRSLVERLDGVSAKHVVVVSTAQIAGLGGYLEDERSGEGPLTPRGASDRARLVLAAAAPRAPVLALLSGALRGDPGPGFDSDGYVSAPDLARLHGDRLRLWRAPGHRSGTPVLAHRQSFERPVLGQHGAPDRRDAYAPLRYARDPAALRRFIERFGTGHPDAVWAERRIVALEAANRREAGRNCDAALQFDSAAILDLGLAVIGRIDDFSRPAELAERWLTAAARATAVTPGAVSGILAECRAAGAPAPRRALAMALLAAGQAEARDSLPDLLGPLLGPGTLMPGEARTGADAATLAGLALAAGLAPPARAGFETEAQASLDAEARSGRAAAALVRGLLLLDRPGRAPEALAEIRSAAEAGMPLARGLYGVLMLAERNFQIRTLRQRFLAPDPETALAYLVAAERRGLAVAPGLVERDGLEAQRRRQKIAHCESRLDFDPRALVSAWSLGTQDDVADAFEVLPRYLQRALAGADLAGWAEACEGIEGLADLPAPLALRLALVLARDGRVSAASSLLARAGGDGFVEFLRAALLWGRDETQSMIRLSAAEQAGSVEATLYRALIGAGRAEETARLRGAVAALAARGLPAAQFLQAVFLGREEDPFAVLQAHVWMERARAAGFRADPGTVESVRARATVALPRYLGFALEPLTQAGKDRYGHWDQREKGVLVNAVTAGRPAARAEHPLVEGMVIKDVGGSALSGNVVEMRRMLLDRLLAGGRVSGFADRPQGQGSALYVLAAPAEFGAFLDSAPRSPGVRVLANQPAALRAGPGGAFAELGRTQPSERVTLLSDTADAAWRRVRLDPGPDRPEPLEGYLPDAAFAAR
ncbi:MAG: hypothetical protein AAF074_04750, partial [Pseudomonadota bacterium]